MRVLSWNCNLNFREDFHSIKNLNADVMIIQECENLYLSSFEGYFFHWIGESKNKGLAVFTKVESFVPIEIFNKDLIYFLPVSFGETAILGVWAFNQRAKNVNPNGSGYILDALNHYENWLSLHKKIIIAGDFNNAPQWDKIGSKNNFVDIDLRLKSIGLKSSYHFSSNENFGEETKFTHFHQKNKLKGFHIDYIYSNFEKIMTSEITDFDKWIMHSDHVPVYADLV